MLKPGWLSCRRLSNYCRLEISQLFLLGSLPLAQRQKPLVSWQTYYKFWHQVTKEEAGEEWLALHPTLQKFAKSANTFDKTSYDAFASGSFMSSVKRAKPSALIFSGIETDVCVLATVLTAVDFGYRTIIAKDAVISSDLRFTQRLLRVPLSPLFPAN